MTEPSAEPRDSARRRLGSGKRLLFGLLLLLGLYAVTEAAAFCAFWAVDRKPFSFARLRASERTVLEGQGQSFDAVQSNDCLPTVHPYLGYVLDPKDNSNGYFAFHGCPVNDFGLLDAAGPIHKRARDRVIIGITGGSVAYYFSALAGETLKAELKRDPAFAGKEIVLVRLALGGYKQPQQVMALNYVLAMGGEFDILINIDGFNEVALPPVEDVALGVHPSFPRLWNRIIQARPEVAVQRLIGKITFLKEARKEWAGKFAALRWPYSVTLHLIWRFRDRQLDKDLSKECLALQRHQSPEQPFCARGPHIDYADDAAMYEDLTELWKRCSAQLDRICRVHDIRYYHFLQPNQYVAGSKPMGDEERRLAYLESHPYRAGVVHGYPLLCRKGAELAQAGERFQDLTMLFAQVDEPLYIDNGCHFNARGNEIMAGRVAAAILGNQAAKVAKRPRR